MYEGVPIRNFGMLRARNHNQLEIKLEQLIVPLSTRWGYMSVRSYAES